MSKRSCAAMVMTSAGISSVWVSLTATAPGARCYATKNALMLDKHTLFIADTFVNDEPDAEQLADIAVMAADEVRRFGIPPKVAQAGQPLAASMRYAMRAFAC